MSALLLASAVFLIIFPVLLRFLVHRSEVSKGKNNIATRLGNSHEKTGAADVSITRRVGTDDGEVLSDYISPGMIQRLQRWIRQANVKLSASEFVLLSGIGLIAGLALGDFIFQDELMALGFAAGLGLSPTLYLAFKRKRRLKMVNEQLPHVLDLVKSSLEAGHSFQRAMQVAVAEFDEPISGELRTVLEQNKIGLPMPRALDEMLERVPDDDLRLLALAVQVQSDVGSSLAQIVGRLAEIVRVRQRLHLQVYAMTSQSRLSGMVVGLLPVIVLFLFSIIRPGYVADMLSDPSGILLLKVAGVLDLTALISIRMLLKVEY